MKQKQWMKKEKEWMNKEKEWMNKEKEWMNKEKEWMNKENEWKRENEKRVSALENMLKKLTEAYKVQTDSLEEIKDRDREVAGNLIGLVKKLEQQIVFICYILYYSLFSLSLHAPILIILLVIYHRCWTSVVIQNNIKKSLININNHINKENMHRRTLSSPAEQTLSFPEKHSMFVCTCSICDFYHTFTVNLPQSHQEPSFETCFSGAKTGDYNWFLLQLANLQKSLPGFNVPDAILWEKGYPTCILKTQSNNKLVKLFKDSITKEFARKVFTLERRGSERLLAKKIAFRGRSLRGVFEDPSEILKTNYKAVLRHCELTDDPKIVKMTLLTDKAFGELFTMWSYERLKTIKSIHSFIKPIGRDPQVIRVRYFSKGHQYFASDNIRVNKCKGIVQKIVDLLERSAHIQIHTLSVEFFTTDKQTLLNNVWDILYSEVATEDASLTVEKAKKLSYENAVMQKGMMKRLKSYEKSIKKPKANHLELLASTIDNRIEQIREITGASTIWVQKAKSPESNAAFAKLRPKCPFELSTVLSPKLTPKKFAILTQRPEVKKREIIKELLYNTPTQRTPKIAISKKEYATTVRESMRFMHHAMPSKDVTYGEFKKSIQKLKDTVQGKIGSKWSRTTTASPDRSDTNDRLFEFIAKEKNKCISRFFQIDSPQYCVAILYNQHNNMRIFNTST
eukprot:TRINITY_DN621_c0_g1_i1.p1 TRINITY_DN621_c0_g1~~TRINITY_DN621_c0_g1_i1.p1  ORF type:complete len:688 (-),score=44.54 TRINITY_DN621_c0_g1_i1:3926-5968(-)